MFLSDSLFNQVPSFRNDYPFSYCRFTLTFSEGFSIGFPNEDECLEMFDIEANAFNGRQESFLNLVQPDFVSSFIFTLNKAKALNNQWEWNGKFKVRNKSLTLSFKARPGMAEENAVWEGMILDITHLKPNQGTAPKLLEIPQNELGKLSHTGTWSLKLAPFQLRWDDESRQIFNLASVHLTSIHKILGLFPKEYNATIRKAMRQAILTREAFDLEIPYFSSGSEWKWIRVAGKPINQPGPVNELIGIIQDVTQFREMEDKIRQNDRFIIDSHFKNEGSWITDLRNGINIWSTEALTLFGFDPDIQGPGFSEVEKKIHPDDLENYRKVLYQGLQEGKTVGCNFRIITPNGQVKPISTVARAIFGPNQRATKLIGYYQEGNFDLKELASQQDAYDEFQSFVKSCPIALAVLDKNLNFIRVSDRWIEEYELQSVKILGKNLFEVSASLNERLGPLLQKAIDSGSPIKENNEEFLLINERWEWIRWEAQPWYESKDVLGGYIIKTEFITERKQAEADLIRVKDDAEKATKAKSEFLSSISHEIRTPLNAVIGFTNLLLQEDPLPHQQEYLNILKFSSENLLILLNDILDFSKIEAEQIKLEEVEFNPRELLSKIRMAFIQKAQEKNLSFRIMMDEDIPKVLIGDPIRLKQILSNLVGNAIKFTPSGKVVINLSMATKDVDHSTLLFEVMDTGIGIEKDKLNLIFEGFTQNMGEKNHEYGGTGLGLTITQKLAKLFGGEVWVESEINKGSTFFLKIKFRNIPQNLDGQKDKLKFEGGILKGIKVLVVEDNPINALLTKVILRQWEVECDFAENGKIGLEMVKVRDYDLVLMDLQMPVMDGYESTKEIRKLPEEKFKILPIIALTASVLEDSKEKAFLCGLDDFLMKPVSHADMYNTIKKFIDKRQSWNDSSLIRSISGRIISPKLSVG